MLADPDVEACGGENGYGETASSAAVVARGLRGCGCGGSDESSDGGRYGGGEMESIFLISARG